MIQSYADCENEVHVDVYDMMFYMIIGVIKHAPLDSMIRFDDSIRFDSIRFDDSIRFTYHNTSDMTMGELVFSLCG